MLNKILGIIGIILITPILLLGILLTIMGFVEKMYFMAVVGGILWGISTYGIVVIKVKCFPTIVHPKFCVHCGSELINRFDVCESCGCVLDEKVVVKLSKVIEKKARKQSNTKLLTKKDPSDEKSNLFGTVLNIRLHDPIIEYRIVKCKSDIDSANLLLKRLHESVSIVDNTVNPNTFFSRLHYSFDVMLELMSYKDRLFDSNCTPEKQYWLQYDYIETRVNKFIDRSYSNIQVEASKLKTEKGRQNKLKKWYYDMLSAFENCHSFWSGNSISPHYRGILYTDNNLKKLKELEQHCLNFEPSQSSSKLSDESAVASEDTTWQKLNKEMTAALAEKAKGDYTTYISVLNRISYYLTETKQFREAFCYIAEASFYEITVDAVEMYRRDIEYNKEFGGNIIEFKYRCRIFKGVLNKIKCGLQMTNEEMYFELLDSFSRFSIPTKTLLNNIPNNIMTKENVASIIMFYLEDDQKSLDGLCAGIESALKKCKIPLWHSKKTS